MTGQLSYLELRHTMSDLTVILIEINSVTEMGESLCVYVCVCSWGDSVIDATGHI